MTCRPVDPCYRWGGMIAQMSSIMADEIVSNREDTSTLSPQQLQARSWIQENIPRAPPGSGLLGTAYNVLRATALTFTSIESSGYFERTPEIQRYEESALRARGLGGVTLL